MECQSHTARLFPDGKVSNKCKKYLEVWNWLHLYGVDLQLSAHLLMLQRYSRSIHVRSVLTVIFHGQLCAANWLQCGKTGIKTTHVDFARLRFQKRNRQISAYLTTVYCTVECKNCCWLLQCRSSVALEDCIDAGSSRFLLVMTSLKVSGRHEVTAIL